MNLQVRYVSKQWRSITVQQQAHLSTAQRGQAAGNANTPGEEAAGEVVSEGLVLAGRGEVDPAVADRVGDGEPAVLLAPAVDAAGDEDLPAAAAAASAAATSAADGFLEGAVVGAAEAEGEEADPAGDVLSAARAAATTAAEGLEEEGEGLAAEVLPLPAAPGAVPAPTKYACNKQPSMKCNNGNRSCGQ